MVIEGLEDRRRKERRKQFFARTLPTARLQRRFMRSAVCDLLEKRSRLSTRRVM